MGSHTTCNLTHCKSYIMSYNALDRTILALDGLRKEEIEQLLKKSQEKIPTLKVGMELYYFYGKPILQNLKSSYNCDFFLDLKLHDIPQTVSKAIQSLEGLPIKMLTVHAQGGPEMLKSALKARDQYLPSCKILAVTYLTSLNDTQINQIFGNYPAFFKQSFKVLVQMAKNTQVDGLILSGHELDLFRNEQALSDCQSMIKVCPGIRFQDEIVRNTIQDQKRVMTPEAALKNGADYLVIGRSLTKCDNINQRLKLLKNIIIK